MKRLFPLANKITSNKTGEGLQLTDEEDIYIIVEAKDEGKLSSVITLDHFQEMIALEDFMMNLEAPASMAAEVGRDSLNLYDICKKDNITEPFVEIFAAEGCKVSPAYCLPYKPETCERS